ncbi:MAG: ribose-phosphate diphosphokinase [Steroidobacteraceae bacterium]
MDARAEPLLFALPESQALAAAIGAIVRLPLAPLEERSFEAGEFKLRPLVSVRDREVYVVQSLAGTPAAPVAPRLLRLLFLLLGLRDAGARRLTLLVPYLAFARKDRRTQPRDPVSSRYVAELLECTGLARLVALDVHNPAAFDNAFRIPTDHLSALPLFAAQVAERRAAAPLAVASPDVGGVKRAQLFRELLGARLGREVDLAFIEKRRALGAVSGGQVVGEVRGREVIVLDDLCATGGTLIRAANALRAAGAAAIHVAFTHAPLAEGLAALAAAPGIDTLLLTDSVGAVEAPPAASARTTVLPVAPLLAEALARMRDGRPLAPLLRRWPPEADG